jgi:FkbM family methyltransferase
MQSELTETTSGRLGLHSPDRSDLGGARRAGPVEARGAAARRKHPMNSKVPLRYRLIRTPLQEPAVLLRTALDIRRFTQPQFNNLRGEDARMLRIMKRLVRPTSNCIDIGCHYGSMLSRMVRLAPRGHHLAFEAMPGKVEFLRTKFPEVDVRELALSDTPGETKFWVNTAHSGFSGLQRHGNGEFEPLVVSCSRLDDEVSEARTFDFVKIDVEGAELLVVRGGAEFLRRDRPHLLFECSPDSPLAFGYQPIDLYSAVVALGYDVYTTHGWLGGDAPVSEVAFVQALEYPFEAFNWFATTTPSGGSRPRDTASGATP